MVTSCNSQTHLASQPIGVQPLRGLLVIMEDSPNLASNERQSPIFSSWPPAPDVPLRLDVPISSQESDIDSLYTTSRDCSGCGLSYRLGRADQ